MFTFRTVAIVTIGAGLFAGLPLTDAQACDDDRFPCPVVSEASPQETATPAKPAPSAQPRKKANTPAPPDKKAQAKVERAAPRAAVQVEGPRAATRTNGSKPAVQEQASAPIAQKASISQDVAEVAPAVIAERPADQAPKKESPNEGLVAAAGTVWPALPNAEGASAEAATVSGAAQATAANAVQVVDAKMVNELDHAAAGNHTGVSWWISYLFLILGAALAAASALWFLPRMISMYARRTADLRMYRSNS
jgi:hypothetical protein